jgi:hypothetical protein
MEDGLVFFVIIGLIIRTVVGGIIGNKHKAGVGWGIVLGAFLGIIGWIIAACSGKKDKPHFDDMSKEDDK